MKNRFDTFGKYASRALCLMSLCGLVWACKDEYRLDDEKPSWLSASLYSYLEEGNFKTYLRLINDPDLNPANARPLSEELGRTGSNTLFVANDQAWDAFFKHNATLATSDPWHTATSYENLSKVQKKLLFKGARLPNAIVMENLASEEGSSQRGLYMRRYTDVGSVDSIEFVPVEDIPFSYNPNDKNYWRRFKADPNNRGIFLAKDSSQNMLVFFTPELLTKQGVTNDDFAKFMGEERQTLDVHVMNALLTDKDNPCENGYINVTSRVIVPVSNMAEVIKSNGKTKIFSHILDRFSYPKYSSALTSIYRDQNPNFTDKDSVFIKKYFALNDSEHSYEPGTAVHGPLPYNEIIQDDKGQYSLKFDPGWNEFKVTNDVHTDMAAMFVPSDDALWEYFATNGGSGRDLIKAYSHNPEDIVSKGDYDALYKQIDDIPLSTLQALVNVMMFNTFTGSVPSKMLTLRNDAHEEMFEPSDAMLSKNGGHIDTCLIACNGAVYIMNKVYGPADYTSVAAPAYISPASHPNYIMKWAIYDSQQMNLNYFAYLKAMKSRFTFFLPSDQALTKYYDPMSFTSQKARIIKIEYTGKGAIPLNFGRILLPYDPSTGEITETPYRTDQIRSDQSSELLNRLKDILESHTIVMDDETPIINQKKEYYLAKNGSAIKVTREGNTITQVQGGFQLENVRKNALSPTIPEGFGRLQISINKDNVVAKDNGMTFTIDDSPIIPTSKSVFAIINYNGAPGVYPTGEFGDKCAEFFKLTQSDTREAIIKACGLDPDKINVWTNTQGGLDMNVSFFNSYNYTVLIPDNASILAEIKNGLPTWDEIEEYYQSLPTYKDRCGEIDPATNLYSFKNDNPDKTDEQNMVYLDATDFSKKQDNPCLLYTDTFRLKTQITYLNNFIRTHFIDSSVFVDKDEFSEKDFITASYDNIQGTFVRVKMKRLAEDCLDIRDHAHTVSVITDDTQGFKNIMTRDMICVYDQKSPGSYSGPKQSPTGRANLNYYVIMSSSFAVVHQIDGALYHTDLVGGRHDNHWASLPACKKYLRQFAIR